MLQNSPPDTQKMLAKEMAKLVIEKIKEDKDVEELKRELERQEALDKENEGNSRSCDLERLAVKTLSEEIGHCCRREMLGHDPCSSSEDDPRKKRTDNCVSDTDPC